VLGLSGALLKSIVCALIGLVIQFTLFLIKRNKSKKLDQLKKQEEEEAKERLRLMEEEWKKADELATKTPDFLHLKEKPVELIKIVSEDDLAIFGTGATHNDNAYDGELT
jgi:hypothetical protein